MLCNSKISHFYLFDHSSYAYQTHRRKSIISHDVLLVLAYLISTCVKIFYQWRPARDDEAWSYEFYSFIDWLADKGYEVPKGKTSSNSRTWCFLYSYTFCWSNPDVYMHAHDLMLAWHIMKWEILCCIQCLTLSCVPKFAYSYFRWDHIPMYEN